MPAAHAGVWPGSEIRQENVPDGNDVTDAAGQHKEVENGMHVALTVERIEYGSRNIAYALGDNPDDGCCRHRVKEGLEGNEYGESHADETEGLYVGVLLQPDEADEGACNGASPHEDEQSPSPVALCAQGDEGEWRVGAGNMPIDGGMVPTAQTFFPCGAVTHQALPAGFFIQRQGVVDGRGDVGAQHAKEVETDAQPCPRIIATERYPKEYHTDNDTHSDAASV